MAELKIPLTESKTAVIPLTEKQEQDIQACVELFSRMAALHRTASVAFKAASEALIEEEAIKQAIKKRRRVTKEAIKEEEAIKEAIKK